MTFTIGHGTWPLMGGAARDAVADALAAGYRLIDTAAAYDNEGAVGAAIRASGVDRAEIILQSKLPGRRHDRREAFAMVQESLWRTGLDRIDRYLIHWPNPGQGRYVQAWEGLIDAQHYGLVREIGVCNFPAALVDELVSATGVPPAINQLEINPWCPQDELVAQMRAHGVEVQAYSPLGPQSNLLERSEIVGPADRLSVSPAQVVLRWLVDRGLVPLPRTTDRDRRRRNLSLAEVQLTPAETSAIDGLAQLDSRFPTDDPWVYSEN
jgi:diketogulonate reductase-like aldo/keto reductase